MLAVIAAVLYGLITVQHALPGQGPLGHRGIRLQLVVAVLMHALSLQGSLWQPQGLNLGLFQVISLIGLMLGTLITLNSMRRGAINLGAWVLPGVALALLGGAFLETGYEARAAGFGLITHVMLALLSYAMFTLTLVYAIVVRVQDRHLKRHQFDGFLKKLPPLQTMERIQYQLAWVSFVLLTLAILVGFVAVENFFGQQIAHKTILTGAAWALFAVLFWGHHVYGWRAVIALRSLIGGYALLSLGFLGSKIVLETILG